MKNYIDQNFKGDLQNLNHLPRFCVIVFDPEESYSSNVNVNYRYDT